MYSHAARVKKRRKGERESEEELEEKEAMLKITMKYT